jgi:hypothetical protein
MKESFRQSGWEYRFYTDAEAGDFLSTHFPPAVREAFEALLPGAFKSDLFRYCVLLIYGGVYADVDILLAANLDNAVPPDVSFMTPIDEPGANIGKKMCLWNGLIAAAPGHPYLAKAIETVVNQVRNRFTSLDVDAQMCPAPALSIVHTFPTLFTAGPCLLGSSVNRVMKRHPMTGFGHGEYKVEGIYGKTVILEQNKKDMGAHRFTNKNMNLIVASTDLPNSNDRLVMYKSGEYAHYGSTHDGKRSSVYGVKNLYKDQNRSNDEIRINIAIRDT